MVNTNLIEMESQTHTGNKNNLVIFLKPGKFNKELNETAITESYKKEAELVFNALNGYFCIKTMLAIKDKINQVHPFKV